MNPDKNGDFEQNVAQLIHLLKKIVKGIPTPNEFGHSKLPMKDSGLQINIHFFSFFPMSDEEWEAIEEMYDASNGALGGREEFSTELNPDDVDFLKRHGISF